MIGWVVVNRFVQSSMMLQIRLVVPDKAKFVDVLTSYDSCLCDG